MKQYRKYLFTLLIPVIALVATMPQPLYVCTGITLVASDGSVVYGRTLEWGSFDLESRIIVIPRNHEMVARHQTVNLA